MNFLEVLGWTGTLLYLINHGYISFYNNWNKTIYYSGNGVAAILLIITSLAIGSWQAVIINLFWAAISARFLIGIVVKRPIITKQYFEYLLVLMISIALISIFLFPNWTFSILGWSSVWAFCIGYLLFSSNHLLPRYYFLYSAYAAIALLPQLWLDLNMAVFFLEIIWAMMSLYAAIKRFAQIHIID